jgi:hypothetical protein
MSSELEWLPLEARATVKVVSNCADIAAYLFVSGFDYFEIGRFGNKGNADDFTIWCAVSDIPQAHVVGHRRAQSRGAAHGLPHSIACLVGENN